MRAPALALLVLATGCSSGLEGPQPIASSNAPLGFDPGVELSSPIGADTAVAGAFIEGGQAKPDRQVVFFAFVTASAADDAGGAGGPALVRDLLPPLDVNGTSDVFLAAIESTDVPTSQGPMPIAFRQGLLNVFTHDRCVHCHAAGHLTPVGADDVFNSHAGGLPPLSNDADLDGTTDCHQCHFSPTHTGTGIDWFAPQPQPFLAAGGDSADYALVFDLRGRTVAELNEIAQIDPTGGSQGGGLAHLKTSENVAWAMDPAAVVPPVASPADPLLAGVEPGSTPNTVGLDRGPVPIARERFFALVDAWAGGGYQADTTSATKDILLVSQAAGAGPTVTSGNAASFTPSVAYRPNPDFEPDLPHEQPAGFVDVVFASDASDLVAGAVVANTDVYRVEFEVWVDQSADGTGDPTQGSIDLRRRAVPTTLVSSTSAGGDVGGNGDSTNPVIDGTPQWVAFESRATNLTTFSDNNAAQPDVFVRHLASETTLLVSSTGGPIDGGDSGSFDPSLSADGSALAFESQATDLVAGDTNGLRDVFFARLDAVGAAVVPGLVRASVQSGGAQASGGASRRASIAVTSAGDVVVAYESDKTNLVVAPGALQPTNVYLYDEDGGGTTTLLSKKLDGVGATVLGDGISRFPVLSPDGTEVVYQTLAKNLEPDEESFVTERVGSTEYVNYEDVILADLGPLLETGIRDFSNRRLSLDLFGRGGRGASQGARIAAFRRASGSFEGGRFVLFSTVGANLGRADSNDQVLVFLNGGG